VFLQVHSVLPFPAAEPRGRRAARQRGPGLPVAGPAGFASIRPFSSRSAALSPNATDYIDTGRYPIDAEGPERAALIARLRAQLDDDGCAVLKGFVRAERIPALVAESDRVAPFAHRNFNRTNPYFTRNKPELPASHPLRRFYDRSNAFVPADNF